MFWQTVHTDMVMDSSVMAEGVTIIVQKEIVCSAGGREMDPLCVFGERVGWLKGFNNPFPQDLGIGLPWPESDPLRIYFHSIFSLQDQDLYFK